MPFPERLGNTNIPLMKNMSDMKKTSLPQPVEQFTISFENRGPNAGVLNMEWENTRVAADFTEANK